MCRRSVCSLRGCVQFFFNRKDNSLYQKAEKDWMAQYSGSAAPGLACFALVHTTLKENCSRKTHLITRPSHCTSFVQQKNPNKTGNYNFNKQSALTLCLWKGIHSNLCKKRTLFHRNGEWYQLLRRKIIKNFCRLSGIWSFLFPDPDVFIQTKLPLPFHKT